MPTGVYERKLMSDKTREAIRLGNTKSNDQIFRLKDQSLTLLEEGEDWRSFPCVVVGTGRVIRLLYIRLFGQLDHSFNVCHYCDTPTCRNPKHWFIATQSENLSDMVIKNRQNYQNQHMKGTKQIGQI
ncbi:MAG TPA: hypothetical protein VGF75_05515 [Candidatus Saccharimonadales bacterium]